MKTSIKLATSIGLANLILLDYLNCKPDSGKFVKSLQSGQVPRFQGYKETMNYMIGMETFPTRFIWYSDWHVTEFTSTRKGRFARVNVTCESSKKRWASGAAYSEEVFEYYLAYCRTTKTWVFPAVGTV